MTTGNIFTLWACLPNDEGAWMVAAVHEWTWEGDPDRYEAEFKAARAKEEADGNLVREVWIQIDHEPVEQAFRPAELTAERVEVRDDDEQEETP